MPTLMIVRRNRITWNVIDVAAFRAHFLLGVFFKMRDPGPLFCFKMRQTPKLCKKNYFWIEISTLYSQDSGFARFFCALRKDMLYISKNPSIPLKMLLSPDICLLMLVLFVYRLGHMAVRRTAFKIATTIGKVFRFF